MAFFRVLHYKVYNYLNASNAAVRTALRAKSLVQDHIMRSHGDGPQALEKP